ncbi:hypothetical protein ES705_19253 [subsurface metagenome]
MPRTSPWVSNAILRGSTMQVTARDKRNTIIVLQFILPSLIVMLIFIIFPILRSIVMAFQEWQIASIGNPHLFIGFDNFKRVFSSSHFGKMAWVTLVFTFTSVIGKMVLGLGVALLLNRKFFGRSFVRGLMLIPWAMPTVVVCNLFMIALDPDFGILSALIARLPMINFPPDFFSQGPLALGTITTIGIWKNFPFISLILLAALESISQDYYDAASIDGAGKLVQFTQITWPLIKPIWNTLLILQILWTVKEFELIYLITRGGPNNATNVIGIDIYLNAFRFYRIGEANAEGVLLLIFCMVFAVIYFRSLHKESMV